MLETQKSESKKSSGEIGINNKTNASHKRSQIGVMYAQWRVSLHIAMSCNIREGASYCLIRYPYLPSASPKGGCYSISNDLSCSS